MGHFMIFLAIVGGIFLTCVILLGLALIIELCTLDKEDEQEEESQFIKWGD